MFENAHSTKDTIVAIAAIGAPLLTWLLMKMDSRFYYGRLTEKVEGNAKELGEVKGVLKEHGTMLAKHGEDIAGLKQSRANGIAAKAHS